MAEGGQTGGGPQDISREEMQSMLFAQLVMQQSGMALMLMGKSPHPETGEQMYDLNAARMFVEQLEMLQTRTRGNLSKSEEALLNQTLMSVRMAYVEAVEHPPAQQQDNAPAEEKKLPAQESAGEDESKKRFSKKFSL